MNRYLLQSLCLAILLGGGLAVQPSEAALVSKIIPDPQQHRAFLYGEWRADQPNLLIFVDPRCPYCKKSIPKYADITGHNVYVFWSPVLGQPSRDIVRPFFRCARPTHPDILASVIGPIPATLPPAANCTGEYDEQLRAINDEIVTNYAISYVPAYYRQGQETSLAAVFTQQPEVSKTVNGVVVDWQRYAAIRVNSALQSRNLALIFSGDIDAAALALIKEFSPAYVFAGDDWNKLCGTLRQQACADDGKRQADKLRTEISILLGLDAESTSVRLISNQGTLSQLR